GRKHRRLQTMREYLRMAFDREPLSIHRRDRFTRTVHQALGAPARWRLDHDVYGFPFEIWLNKAGRSVFRPLKPKVDAQLLASEPVTC
ncbi:MAG: radical SAM protein, partial [Acidobacteria bacterium]|nr:radical SAM protein [Acidobacteriota bacterium]